MSVFAARGASLRMATSISISSLLALWLGTISIAGQPMRIMAGSPPAPVIAGEVWLVGNRWGAYPGILVAKISDGQLRALNELRYPPYWNQAFNYTLLVAITTRTIKGSRPASEEWAYGPSGRPEYLEDFPLIYLSAHMSAHTLGRNWEAALQSMGRTSGNTVELPPPTRRAITFEYPDGRPLLGARVPVLLYGSHENHCGVPVGIELGNFATDSKGRVSFIATNSPLALARSYYQEKFGGPAGTMFIMESYMLLGRAQDITVKRLWTLPSYHYVLRVQTAGDRPMADVRLRQCDNFDGCGTGCGPVFGAPPSSSSGIIRFQTRDLREARSLTLVNAAGRERQLTNGEMRALLTGHRVQIRW